MDYGNPKYRHIDSKMENTQWPEFELRVSCSRLSDPPNCVTIRGEESLTTDSKLFMFRLCGHIHSLETVVPPWHGRYLLEVNVVDRKARINEVQLRSNSTCCHNSLNHVT